jgi:hypothetical protein
LRLGGCRQEVDLSITPTIRELAWGIEEKLARDFNNSPRNPKRGNSRALDDDRKADHDNSLRFF